MATAEELTVVLDLDTTAYTKSLGNAERQADSFLSGFKANAALLAGTGIALAASALTEGLKTVVSFSADAQAAVRDLEARLGVTQEEAERLGEVGERVFLNNFGGSIDEAILAVGEAERSLQSLGNVSDEELQKIAEGAFAIQDTFGVDTSETIDGVKALMSDLGLTAEESLDFITAGFQRGLPEDFLETLTEYSLQFDEIGFSAEEAFSFILTGAEEGLLGTEKAADAIKEAGIRLSALDKGAVQAFDDLGITLGLLEDGSVDVDQGIKDAIAALSELDDGVARNQAGAAIFGTQWEDLAGRFVDNVDFMAVTLEDLEGSTEKLNRRYESFGAIGEAAQRKILVALAPIGDKLLELANTIAPVAFSALDWIGETLPLWIDTALGWFDTFTGDLDSFGGEFGGTFDTVSKITEDTGKVIELVWKGVSGFFEENGSLLIDILTTTFDTAFTVVDAALTIISRVIDTVLAIIEGDWDRVWDNILEIISTIIKTIVTVVENALENLESAFTLGAEAIQGIWGAFTGWLEEQLGLVPGFFDIDLFRAGQAIISSLWDGMRRRIDGLLSWVRDQAQKISDLLPGSEPKDPTSPLIRLPDKGEAIIDNIQAGLDRAAPLRLNIQGLLDDLASVSQLSVDFQSAANNLLGQIQSGITGQINNPISGLIGGASGQFQTGGVTNQINMDLRDSGLNEDRVRNIVDTSFRNIVSESRNIRLTT